jgi:hypothetical protein
MRIEKLGGNRERMGLWPVPDEIIASFGQVRLIRKLDGRHELKGGTLIERETAKEWCREYAPFVVFGDALEGTQDVSCLRAG